jgi:putative PIN family toxin of toxin-antitoxin system
VRIVVDTNVLIAGLVAEGLCRDIVKRRLQICEVVTSRPLLQELEEKLRVKFHVDPSTLPLLELYAQHAMIVDVVPLAQPVCRDPDDDVVLATALAGQVAAIVTGDGDLLVLQEFQGIKILSPRQFVSRLDEQA